MIFTQFDQSTRGQSRQLVEIEKVELKHTPWKYTTEFYTFYETFFTAKYILKIEVITSTIYWEAFIEKKLLCFLVLL